ncbi:MFS transporter [Microbacterium rhizophilus]|uniref:MFS transporter n=1 Tax=Microbacterium rhizophilus TaxID=3138934 RepID=UPI0031EDE3EE
MTEPASTAPAADDTRTAKRQATKAAIGSYVGTTVEFYDFALYLTASTLIFPTVFFSGVDGAAGIVLSYLTLAAGYLARPAGAILFGHFGDKLGRKRMLIITLFVMGLASMGIGLIPDAATIGGAAPIILIVFRIIQGIAVGGEWAGASLMAMEHSSARRRGLAASVVASGGPSGSLLATLVLSLVSLLPGEQLYSWGWRLAFLISAVLIVIGLVLRSTVSESPQFLAAREARGVELERRVPLFETLRSNWRSVLFVMLAAVTPFFVQPLIASFAVGYAVGAGNPQAEVLWMLTLANLVNVLTVLGWAALSDRIGRRRSLMIGYAIMAVAIWAVFALLGTSSILLVLLAFILANPLAHASIQAPLAAYMNEMFPIRNRYTGVSISYQVTTTIASGFAPLVATGFVAAGDGSTALLTLLVTVLSAVGFIAVLGSRRLHERFKEGEI